jgi:hypothetical protein
MDLMKLRQALAMLKAFADSLPDGDIEEKYVNLYHKTLDDIRAQYSQDLSYFHIPQEELTHRPITQIALAGIGDVDDLYTENRYCDRERFLMALRGAVNFINALTLDSSATTLPLIDPPK